MELKLEKVENLEELKQEELLEVEGGVAPSVTSALPWVKFFKGYYKGYKRSQDGKGYWE
ncbi:class IIb bacteriocin, lactobin A/cerein 7B family [Bacillus mycoides]|uniref:class IIb bacteriocin, lactobin A/cerein 7B family n=1 Tax=Bacillus mycoides TaxID=1405 RepID=UPI003D066F68